MIGFSFNQGVKKTAERVGELYLIHVKKSGLWIVEFFIYNMLFPILTSAHAYIAKSTPMENEMLIKVPPIRICSFTFINCSCTRFP